METFDVGIPPGTIRARLRDAVRAAISSQGLAVTLETHLAKHPGSEHWHIKRIRQTGTLEVTITGDPARLWFSIQAGRQGEWLRDAIAAMTADILRELSGP